jgi:hypothetical protein
MNRTPLFIDGSTRLSAEAKKICAKKGIGCDLFNRDVTPRWVTFGRDADGILNSFRRSRVRRLCKSGCANGVVAHFFASLFFANPKNSAMPKSVCGTAQAFKLKKP